MAKSQFTAHDTVPLRSAVQALSPERRASVLARFWEKVDKQPGGCWLWTSAKDRDGYGLFWFDKRYRSIRAHRLAYALIVGAIPYGYTLDHECRNKGCVNPAHLDPCTFGENAARSPNAPYNVKARQTHCKRGHEFTPENTRRRGNRRSCIACAKLYAKKRWAEKKARREQ